MGFLLKTVPYKHQLGALVDSADREYYALLMSMRTGKSKVIIDTSTHLYGKGKIDCVVVVAPNGVHRNWIVNEVPTHQPDEVACIPAFWRSGMTKAQQKEWDFLYCEDSIPLRFVTMSYDAVITPKGKEELKRLLTAFRCMLVLDESHRIKTPGAKRTKVLMAAAKYAVYRRILTGTSITQGPLDLYTQLKFLDPFITGFTTFTTFKAHYAVIEQRRTNNNRRGFFEHITGYRNLNQLHEAVAPHATIIRAEDCVDLPDKVYETVYSDLTAEQRRIYNDLLRDSVADLTADATGKPPVEMSLEEQMLWLLGDGDKVKADNALTKLLRLQQVIGGHVPNEEGEVRAIKSTRLKTLLDTIESIDGKVIIWARFRPELDAIAAALREAYGDGAVVEYHGGIDDDARASAVASFQDATSEVRFFVSNPQAGGIGLPLHAATAMVYYSNDFSLETRLQSEERASRVGKEEAVLVIDMVAPDTVDEKVTEALRNKNEQAEGFYRGVQSI